MTDAERERHLAWHRAHPAGGSRGYRRAKSDQAHQNEAFRRLAAVELSLPATDPETVRINGALEVARAKLALLEARADKTSDDNEGVFA